MSVILFPLPVIAKSIIPKLFMQSKTFCKPALLPRTAIALLIRAKHLPNHIPGHSGGIRVAFGGRARCLLVANLADFSGQIPVIPESKQSSK
jgi:hypothetical protein